ncbi:MAG: aldo/keto reductase [Chitinophagaceae bacterium]
MTTHQHDLPPVISGCMKWGQWGEKFNTGQYEKLIKECLQAGITTFDHADIYGGYTTEEEFGEVLRKEPALRDRMQLITKCGIRMIAETRPAHHIKSYDTSAAHILQSAERSLKNLATDYLDILLIHRPDPLMHPDEIAAAFTTLKQQGKVLHFGVSNFEVSHVSLVHARFPVEYNQLEISVAKTDAFFNGQLDQCIELGIRPMAWSPLGGGLLMSSEADLKGERILQAAGSIAAAHHCTPDQVLLAFLMKHPSRIIPVLGTTKIERLISGKEAALVNISREEWFMLLEAAAGKQVP